MKTYLFCFFSAFFFLASLTGCNHQPKPGTDNEENTYFSAYRDIYKNYGIQPVDTTKQLLETYLQEFPENDQAWLLYGNVCFKTGDYGNARVSYSKAIAIDNSKPVYYSALGTAYSAENMLDSAEKYLLKAIQLKDTSPYTLLNLAILYNKRNDVPKSETFADAAAMNRDSSAIIYSGLSYVYMRNGQKQKSHDMFEAAKALGLKDTSGLNDVLADKMRIEDFYRKNY